MRLTLLLLLVAALCFALSLSQRGDDLEPVRASDHEVASVNAYATQRSLGDHFDELVAAYRKPAPRARTAPRPTSAHGHPCGGDLPPCWVMMRESGGNIHAYNPTGCGGRGCRGKWQCDPRTCSGTGSEEQQDAEARALWRNGAGCSHWQAC